MQRQIRFQIYFGHQACCFLSHRMQCLLLRHHHGGLAAHAVRCAWSTPGSPAQRPGYLGEGRVAHRPAGRGGDEHGIFQPTADLDGGGRHPRQLERLRVDEGGVPVGRAAWDAKFGADYHQASDEWSADLDFTSAVENLTLLYRLGLDLANSGDWPGWKPTSEFGAVRARSADARR